MVGYQVPHFEELKQIIYKFVDVDKRVSIVGWDVTFTDKGIEFIEMNSPGGHDILQFWGTPYWNIIKETIYDSFIIPPVILHFISAPSPKICFNVSLSIR
jgi:hypothetical protein